MRIPKKCGDMYIMFDENGNVQYGFVVDYLTIKRFINLSDKMPTEIVLPRLVKEDKVTTWPVLTKEQEEELTKEGLMQYVEQQRGKYLKGQIMINDKCFKGVKNARIIVTSKEPVNFAESVFDNDAVIEFVLPKQMKIKDVFSRQNGYFDYIDEKWLLIADKRIQGRYTQYNYDYFAIRDYETKHDRFYPTITERKTKEAENDIQSEEEEL